MLLAGCVPSEPGAQTSIPRDFSGFDQFEYKVEGLLGYADAGLVGATIQRQPNGQYQFQATLLNPPPQPPQPDLYSLDLTDTTDDINFQDFLVSMPPRKLTQDETERMRQVFSHAITDFTFFYPICAFIVAADIFRWDGFVIYANPSCSGPIQWLDSASSEEILNMLENFRQAGG